MFKDLKHLSDEQINDLMNRYYNGDNVKGLLKDFNLNITPSHLYTYFPVIKQENYECEYCHDNLVLDRVSKSMKNSKRFERELYCPKCGHKPFDVDCVCVNCIEYAQKEVEKMKELIFDCYPLHRKLICFDDLSFTSKVYLGCICRTLLKENLHEILPYNHINKCLAPSDKLLWEIYDNLTKNKVIVVSPYSDIEAFKAGDNFPNEYYIYKVIYNLNLEVGESKQTLISQILNPQYYTKKDAVEAYDLWLKIATEECIEYLIFQLKKVGFEFNPGEKTYTVIQIMLKDFSVSQIYGIIWKSIADASKLYLETGISKKQAANTVIGACQRLSERAILNKWDMTKYGRIKDLPQSSLSEFFFNKVLKIGDLGFNMPPSDL